MNSTNLNVIRVFLNMLKFDIKKYIYERNGLAYNPFDQSIKNELLTGQTISRQELENLTSMKMMNEAEKNIIYSMLDDMKAITNEKEQLVENPSNTMENSNSNELGKQLVKTKNNDVHPVHRPPEMPVEFKDAA